jgi:hypothetical protein
MKHKIKRLTHTNILIYFLIFNSLFILNGCVESNFLLANDSRLPKWVELPDKYQREDVSASLFLFTIGKASLIIRGPKPERKTIARFRIRADWHESSNEKVKQIGNYSFRPLYYKVSYKGVEDIIEFPCLGPVFRMADKINEKIELNQIKCKEVDLEDIGNPW